MKMKDIPSGMHYAVLLFVQEYRDDTYGGRDAVDVMEYLVMEYKDLVPWVERNRDKQYKIVEVYPMTVHTSITINSSKHHD